VTRGVSPEGYEDFGGRAALGSQVFPECGGVRPLLVINDFTGTPHLTVMSSDL